MKNRKKKNSLRYPSRFGFGGQAPHTIMTVSLGDLSTKYKVLEKEKNEAFDPKQPSNRNIIPIVFPDLQRPYGSWSEEDKLSFISSLYGETAALSSLILVNVTSVRDYCKNQTNVEYAVGLVTDQKSKDMLRKHFEDTVEYLNKYIDKYGRNVMLCIEGQHRLITSKRYIESDISFTGDAWVYNTDGDLCLEYGRNKFFHEFPEQDRQFFLNNTFLTFHVVEKATQYFMNKTFVHVNSCKPPNPQHRRDSSIFPIAGEVKDIAAKDITRGSSLFNTIFSPNDIKACRHNEFVAFLFSWVKNGEYGTSVTNAVLDEMYEDINSEYSYEEFKNEICSTVEEDLEFVRRSVTAQGVKTKTKGFAIGLVLVKQALLNLGYQIVDTEVRKFAVAFEQLDRKLSKESLSEALKDDSSTTKTYWYWSEKSVTTPASMGSRISKIQEKITENENKILSSWEEQGMILDLGLEQEILVAAE